MTARGAIVLFLFGLALTIMGATIKIMHWPYADALLAGASLMQTISVLVLAYKVFSYPGAKDFLDR
ncbi:MAG: hypothetical protein IPK70_13605 [Flavobacteriales bacterium]|jgi:hypothetical protein|nr:hypothetical protein [Flavobacteriales bacterium]